MERYMHIPLRSSRTTRVLHLHPSSDLKAPLSGHLKEGSFKSNESHHGAIWQSEPFEALSYVWGPPSSSHFVSIQEKLLPITANCDAALRRLRLKRAVRVLWVDAICIDQTRTEAAVAERGIQVAMMGDIYEGATSTILWLGEGGERAETVFKFLSRYAAVSGMSESIKSAIISRFKKSAESKHKTTAEQLFLEVMRQPWFERMWTLQELLLSKHPIVMCGSSTLDWKKFKIAPIFASITPDPDALRMMEFVSVWEQYERPFRFFGKLMKEKQMREWMKDEERRAQLLSSMVTCDINSLLRRTRGRKAKEPRDKVFALNSVVQRFYKHLPPPNYKDSVTEVYIRATMACLEQDSYYTVLEHTWSRERRPDLPSWVPDFSDGDTLNPPFADRPDGSGTSIEKHTTSKYAARLSGHKLHVWCKVLGIITATSPGIEIGAMGKEMNGGKAVNETTERAQPNTAWLRKRAIQVRVLRAWSDLVSNMARLSGNSNRYPEGISSAFYHALLALVHEKDGPVQRAGFAAWERLIRSHETEAGRQHLLGITRERFGDYAQLLSNSGAFSKHAPTLLAMLLCNGPVPRPDTVEPFEGEEEALRFHDQLGLLLYDTSMFVTREGHLGFAFSQEGYAYGEIRGGDVLVHVAHCRSPLLLRRKGEGEGYLLLSPAFSYGLEFESEDSQESDFQEIVLAG